MLYAFYIFDRSSHEVLFYHSYDGDQHLMTFTQLALMGLEAMLKLYHNFSLITAPSFDPTPGPHHQYFQGPGGLHGRPQHLQYQDKFFGHLMSTESLHVYGYMTNSQYKFIAITSGYLPPTAPVLAAGTGGAATGGSSSAQPLLVSSPLAGQISGVSNNNNINNNINNFNNFNTNLNTNNNPSTPNESLFNNPMISPNPTSPPLPSQFANNSNNANKMVTAGHGTTYTINNIPSPQVSTTTSMNIHNIPISNISAPSLSTIANKPNQPVLSPLIVASYQTSVHNTSSQKGNNNNTNNNNSSNPNPNTTNNTNSSTGSYISTNNTTLLYPNGAIGVLIKGQPEPQQVQFIQTFFNDISKLILRALSNPLSDLNGFVGDLNYGQQLQVPLFQPLLNHSTNNGKSNYNQTHLFAINTQIKLSTQSNGFNNSNNNPAADSINYTNPNNIYGDHCLIQNNSPNLFSSSIRFQNSFIALFNSAQV